MNLSFCQLPNNKIKSQLCLHYCDNIILYTEEPNCRLWLFFLSPITLIFLEVATAVFAYLVFYIPTLKSLHQLYHIHQILSSINLQMIKVSDYLVIFSRDDLSFKLLPSTPTLGFSCPLPFVLYCCPSSTSSSSSVYRTVLMKQKSNNFFFFGHTPQLVGSQFPDERSNLCPQQWTTREFLPITFKEKEKIV